MDKPSKSDRWHSLRKFFTPSFTTIVIVLALGALTLSGYPTISFYTLYPLWALYTLVIQPLIFSFGHYDGYVEVITWVIPSLAVPYFYVVACSTMGLARHYSKNGKLISRLVAGSFLAALVIIPPFTVPFIVQAYAPPPPKDMKLSLDNASCELLPQVVSENKGNVTFTTEWNDSLGACVFAGTMEIPYSHFSITIPEQSILVIRGDNSIIRAEVHNMGTVIIDEGSSFVTYGLSNDGVIHVKKTGVLEIRGMISSPSRIDIVKGEVLPADPERIQIIIEGLVHQREQFGDEQQFSNGYIENFGAIDNRGGTLLDEGEIASFSNATIFNTMGGKIQVGSHASLGISNMTNANAGSIVENHGNIYNSGTLRNIDGAVIDNIGFGIITNQGTILNENASILNRDIGQIVNNWTILNGCKGIIEGQVTGNLSTDTCSN